MAPDSGEEQTSRPVLGCAPDTPQSSSKKAAAKEGEGEGKEEEEEGNMRNTAVHPPSAFDVQTWLIEVNASTSGARSAMQQYPCISRKEAGGGGGTEKDGEGGGNVGNSRG